MKIIFNQKLTDEQIVMTKKHNIVASRKRITLSFISAIIAGFATWFLAQQTGKIFLSFVLAGLVGNLLLPSIIRDIFPAFKLRPDLPSFLYAAVLEEATNAHIDLSCIKKNTCKLTVCGETVDGLPIRGTFDVPVERKEELTEIIVDFERNIVCLPVNDFFR